MQALRIFIICVCVVFVSSTKKYYVFKINKLNWHAAAQDCLSRGLQLATITSSAEQTDLEDVLKGSNVGNNWLWTSGTDQGEEGNFFWMSTGKPIIYSKWSRPQPDNAGGRENCVHIWMSNGVYTWNDWLCEKKLYYICEDKPDAQNVINIEIIAENS